MHFNSCITELGTISTELLTEFVDKVQAQFGELWQTRTLKIMAAAKVLKGKSPSSIDELQEENRAVLWHLMEPIIQYLPSSKGEVIYADVSSLPAGKQIGLHVDSILMHALSTRIHVPLITNPRTKMGFINSTGAFEVHHLKVGTIYEVNNMLPHAVINGGTEDRWHLLFDLALPRDIKFMTGQETKVTVDLITNHLFSPIITTKMYHALTK